MSSKSKNKGKSWENDVCKTLASVYGESFIRVPNSGAYIGGKNNVRKEILHEGQIRMMKGDIIPPVNWTKFNCECKNYGDFPFHQLWTGSCKQLDAWIEQMFDAADANDLNILFIKITRKGKFVAVQDNLGWNTTPSIFNYKSQTYNNWLIFDYDQFFNLNSQLLKQLSI